MKSSAVLLGLVAVLALAGGCERKETVEEPRVYDPAIDPPPSPIVVEPDPGLLANQVEIAKKSPKRAAPAPAPTEATTDSVEGVKQTILKMAETVETKQFDKLSDFFMPEDAAAIKTLLAALPTLQAKAARLEQLMKDRFGTEMPKELAGLKAFQLDSALLGQADRATILEKLESLQFTPKGNRVLVSGSDMPQTAYVNVGGTWKIELSPQQRQATGASLELVKASEKLLDSLIAGISDGSITQANFPAKFQELAQAIMEPVMAKVSSLAGAGKLPSPPAAPAGTSAPPSPVLAEPNAPAAKIVGAPAVSKDPSHLEAVLALWMEGKRDEAAEELLLIDWQKPAAFRPDSLLGMTEEQFSALPEPQQPDKVTEAGKLTKSLRDLGRHVGNLARNAFQAGDKAKAQRYIDSIVSCGKFFQTPEHMMTFQGVAESLIRTPNPFTVKKATTQPAAPPAAPAVRPAEPSREDDLNKDRGPEKAQELRRRLLAPATRVYGGGP